ncbi:hypothetical protein niasHT_026648 [Heterodera trifolii]|uniref:Uncharacterized protein n=1 Tax=Heterodera trifolii TaxID=157864 RepID=A0ABD2KSK3_9BILA
MPWFADSFASQIDGLSRAIALSVQWLLLHWWLLLLLLFTVWLFHCCFVWCLQMNLCESLCCCFCCGYLCGCCSNDGDCDLLPLWNDANSQRPFINSDGYTIISV